MKPNLSFRFTLERLGILVDHLINTSLHDVSTVDDDEPQKLQRVAGLWSRLNIQSRILPALEYDGDSRVRVSALKCLRQAAASIPRELSTEVVETKTLDRVHCLAVEGKAEVWLQCEALSILAQNLI